MRMKNEQGRNAGMHIYNLPPDELKRWKKQSQPVIDMYEPIIGKDILDALYKLAEQG